MHLTPLEYRVLECLARQAGMIVTQKQLIREVWGPDRLGDTRSLRVCIKNLRQKLEPDPARPRHLVDRDRGRLSAETGDDRGVCSGRSGGESGGHRRWILAAQQREHPRLRCRSLVPGACRGCMKVAGGRR